MKRRLFTILSALSLLLCVITGTGLLFAAKDAPSLVDLGIGRWGDPWYVRFTADDGLNVYVRPAPDRPASDTSDERAWYLPGFSVSRRYTTTVRQRGIFVREWNVHVQANLILLFSSVLPALWLAQVARRASRRSSGRCPSCGYDLRATPGRCPECGRVPAAPPPPL